ncbi:MAG: hypothetical protein R3F60_33930 [bacterium]
MTELTPLQPADLASFRARFGDGGDGLIRDFSYDFPHSRARVVLAVRRPDGVWVNLAIEVSGVDHWAAIHTPQSCWQVLSDGFSLLHADDAWYLDLAPDFAAPASPAVVSRSPFHVRGAVIRYAELPYDYPRA